MDRYASSEDLGLNNIFPQINYRLAFHRQYPLYLNDIGTMIFCGAQGSGKTLSAVNYVYNLFQRYKFMILCTNVSLSDYPFNAFLDCNHRLRRLDNKKLVNLCSYDDYINGAPHSVGDGELEYICVEYSGLDDLKYLSNFEFGVVYFIDELHLELNSLESKNIDIDVMIEISQQRKQRKKIIGTSQIYMRLAKPLREQVFDVCLCQCFFKCLQFNKYIDGSKSYEKDGKLKCDIKRRVFYIHDLEMYNRYDTFAKMKRYNNEWQGRERVNYVRDF